jgi:glycosyltransferase involved in cell wall biosynthesis
MRAVIRLVDILGFALFGAAFAAMLAAVFLVSSALPRKRRRAARTVSRFSFPVYDLISHKYDSMAEDALLNGYIAKDHYVYLDFGHGFDRYENIEDRIFFRSVAAHPDNALYGAGFRGMSALMTEMKILRISFMTIWGKGIDFIKAHDPHLLGLNGILLARLFRVPLVIHLNSDFDMKYLGVGRVSAPLLVSRELERLLESAVIQAADMVVADRKLYSRSKSFPKKSLAKYRAVGVRVDRTHYAPLDSRRDLRKDLGLEGKRILLYVGRLHDVKYPKDAIAAFAAVKARIDHAVLLVVGSGDLRRQLEEMTRSLGLADSVIFLGRKGYGDLINIFSTADLFLAPHGGVTLVESALAGTPIVAYDFDWHSEFLEDGKMGGLVRFRDAEAMGRKAVEILMDEGLRSKMSRYCREAALERCSRERSVENERGVYDQLLGA